MANSDNVLRGGLTPKHVDVQELLQTIRPVAASPVVVRAEQLAEHVSGWKTTAVDFSLRRVVLQNAHDVADLGVDTGPRIIVCTAGLIDLRVGEVSQTRTLRHGEAAYVMPHTDLRVATERLGTVFVASIPSQNAGN